MVLIHQRILKASHRLEALAEKIVRIQKEEAPLVIREGGIFKKGTTPELDRLLSLTEDGQRWLMELENRERENTGISSLKVRYNRVFGYYIEITQAHLKSVPSHYQRKQTMVGAERFFTDELKKFEEEILTASTRQKSMEQNLFGELLEEIQRETSSIMEAARVLGEFDSLVALSQLAQKQGWCFPKVDQSRSLQITAGRHAVVDQAKKGNFVPNDLSLSPETRLTLLITGPNMGGKSTLMRQTALIIILGQMGAPVPAHSAEWGVFSSVYTRIGAQDAISRGQSTFMVEMSELAHILHYADDQSLLILDEIGRGTSTYDGMSVAWATLEWICKKIGARTLFATHYHELIHLSETLPGLANAHMAVENEKSRSAQSLRFLYELKEGPTNESFGIQVAQMAGLPRAVIERAWNILGELESSESQQPSSKAPKQLSLFDSLTTESPAPLPPEIQVEKQDPPQPHPMLTRLAELNLNEMTPLQALTFLSEAQGSLLETI
jgi:DNA mismatch repair protein MutS